MGHKQTTLTTDDGRNFEVDSKIAPLIRDLNRLPGIYTLNSCQDGYVQIGGDYEALILFASGLLSLMFVEGQKWKWKSKKYGFHFTVEVFAQPCINLRWLPKQYKHVLKCVKEYAAL
jgi:hypothetical protein